MPSLQSDKVYEAAFKATYDLLSGGSAEMLDPAITLKFPVGTAVYRYSSKTISDGGEANGRKVWRRLAIDVDNRWSGIDPKGGGVTGLYMALENSGALTTEFSELVHYQEGEVAKEGEHPSLVEIQKYDTAEKKRVLSSVNNLFFMWLFFTTKPMVGLNLCIPHGDNVSPFMKRIFMKVAGDPALKGMSPEQWYLHENDASFCRGVGNAALSDLRYDFIRVTSARSADLSTKNIIIPWVGGPSTEPYPHVKCAGRSSFFLNADGTHDAGTTEADKAYNQDLKL